MNAYVHKRVVRKRNFKQKLTKYNYKEAGLCPVCNCEDNLYTYMIVADQTTNTMCRKCILDLKVSELKYQVKMLDQLLIVYQTNLPTSIKMKMGIFDKDITAFMYHMDFFTENRYNDFDCYYDVLFLYEMIEAEKITSRQDSKIAVLYMRTIYEAMYYMFE